MRQVPHVRRQAAPAAVEQRTLQVEAVDEWGNRATATRTLQVSPRANANAPQVAIRCLPGSVPPGL